MLSLVQEFFVCYDVRVSKPLYQYIFDLLDYADAIAERISPSEPEKNNYFMTLVYIEDILDKYGRGLVVQSSREAGEDEADSRELLKRANQQMDALRKKIRLYSQQYDFDEVLSSRGKLMYEDWHKLPKDHPNIQSLAL